MIAGPRHAPPGTRRAPRHTAGELFLTFYYNGVDRFGSLTGGPGRE